MLVCVVLFIASDRFLVDLFQQKITMDDLEGVKDNPKSAGRRRGSSTKGRAVTLQGRPKGMKLAKYPQSKADLQIKEKPTKRPHSLSSNITKGVPSSSK